MCVESFACGILWNDERKKKLLKKWNSLSWNAKERKRERWIEKCQRRNEMVVNADSLHAIGGFLPLLLLYSPPPSKRILHTMWKGKSQQITIAVVLYFSLYDPYCSVKANVEKGWNVLFCHGFHVLLQNCTWT